MKKHRLLIGALCISMAATLMPVGALAASEEDVEEIVLEMDEAEDEGSDHLEADETELEIIEDDTEEAVYSFDEETDDSVELLDTWPSALEGYGYEELMPLTLHGVEAAGTTAESHLYTLKAGEKVEFTDGVTDEVSATYTEGATFALLKGGTDTIKFRPVNYDSSKKYNVKAIFGEDIDATEFGAELTDLGGGVYGLKLSWILMDLDVYAEIDPSSYVPGEFAGGSGTASDPYQIGIYDQLLLMDKQTKTGLYYKLVADIEANTAAPSDYSENVWTPIDPKGCYFDGAGHTISNLCIDTITVSETVDGKTTDKNYAALFGPQGTVEELKNVTVKNVHIKGEDQYSASLAIKVKNMTDCTLSGDFTLGEDTQESYQVGGLAYEATGKVSGCTYDAHIHFYTGKYVGGIVYIAPDVENCSTTKDSKIELDCDWRVSGWGYRTPNGGIAGIVYRVDTAKGEGLVKGNSNNAKLDGKCDSQPHDAAGIVMSVSDGKKGATVTDNHNFGQIKGNYVSGIMGTLNGDLSSCDNSGKIEGYICAAGIVAGGNKGCSLTDCTNTGKIIATAKGISGFDMEFGGAAGIVGDLTNAKAVKNCINKGAVEANVAAAGVIGIYSYWDDALVDGCANAGTVSGSEAGGLIFEAAGATYYSDGGEKGPGRLTIRNSYNSGTVKMSNNTEEHGWGFGGLVGSLYNADVENCFNAGLVDESLIAGIDSSRKASGGIVGDMRSTSLKNCYNIGTVKAASGCNYAIAGVSTGSKDECSMTGCYYLDGSGSKAAGFVDGTATSSLKATKLTAAAMKNASSFSGWDFDTVWQVGKNESYPYPELVANPYEGPKAESPDDDVEFVTGGVFVVNQKFDITGSDFFGKSYAKYTVVPKGSAAVSKKGIVTVKKVPKEGTITIYGWTKSGSKFSEEKAFVFTAEKPVVAKNVTFKLPYDGSEDEKSSVPVSSLISGATVTPTTWVSSKPEIAAYDAATGRIIARSKGTAKVSAVFGDPDSANSAKYTVTVKVNIPKISKKTAAVQSGATLKLKINGVAKTSKVTWSVAEDDLEYVTVDNDTGVVTALKYKAGDSEDTDGTVIVRGAIDGKEYDCYVCEVTVVRPKLAKNELPAIKVGKTAKITVKNTKFKAKDGGGITFESSDTSIATVDATGKVKAVAPGTCTIDVKVAGCTLPCKITVK